MKYIAMMRYLILFVLACWNILSWGKIRSENNKLCDSLTVKEWVEKADSCWKINAKDSAIVYYAYGYGRYHKELSEHDIYWCAVAALRLADIYYYSANYSMSLELYIKGLHIIESSRNRDIVPSFYIGLGNVYWLFDDLENAGVCYEKGYEESVVSGDTVSRIRLANHLSGIYCYTKNNERAEFFIKEANRFNTDTVAQGYLNMLHNGLICVNKRKYDEAAFLFRESGRYALAHSMKPKYECSSYEELYKMYKKIGNVDSTKYYLNKCYSILSEYPMLNMLPACLKNMAELYKQEGNVDKANYFQGKYIQITDSVFKVREVNKLRTMQILYGAEKLNHDLNILKDKQKEYVVTIEKQRLIIVLTIVGLLLLLAISWYVYVQRCKFFSLYKKLFLLNNELSGALNKSKEIHQEYERKFVEYKQIVEEQKLLLEGREEDDSRCVVLEEKYRNSKLTENQKDKLVKSILEVMENSLEFCNSDFSLNRLSSLVNSNSLYVSQVINEQFHRNFNSFCNSYRVKEACKKLKDKEKYGHYTIKAISESVGFKSQTTFIKTFKEETGMPPSVYQRIAKSEIA